MAPAPTTAAPNLDPRAQRTRGALFDAFKVLVLEVPYAQLRVEDILRCARVSRSTFYQHFDGKDDLLTQSMDPLLRALADPNDIQGLRSSRVVLEHFWENRRYAEAIFDGPAGIAVLDHLTRLHEQATQSTVAPLPARRLACRAAAHGQLGILLDWLTGRLQADLHTVVEAITALRPR